VERWSAPLLINERNQNELRIGFDWIIDIDSGLGLDEAKIAACLIRDFLDSYGLGYIVKFSGRRGFHFCVFWENFPEVFDYKETKVLYPELPKLLALFLREKIMGEFVRRLEEEGVPVPRVKESDLMSPKDPYRLVEVEKDWSNRHLFRMPYSIHEKTGLVSVPINPAELEKFEPEMAQIGKVEFRNVEVKAGSAERLIGDAYFWMSRKKEAEEPERKPKTREIVVYRDKILRDNFPPCIEKILGGLKDGRKRSAFTLITFLRCCNWTWAEVEEAVLRWGKENGMREGFVNAQLMWHKRQAGRIIPPNCENGMFYKDIAICSPLPLCQKIKNPINFAIIKAGRGKAEGKKGRRKRRAAAPGNGKAAPKAPIKERAAKKKTGDPQVRDSQKNAQKSEKI
ncbi:MAG: DNA primase small subunit domain-containing protein, partial [Candidatus Aenigmatarchaeota archaeon]